MKLTKKDMDNLIHLYESSKESAPEGRQDGDQKVKLKKYPIQVPPNSIDECIDIMHKSGMTEDEMVVNINGEEVSKSLEEAIEDGDMTLETSRHEALHGMQIINIPSIFDNLPELSHNFSDSEDYKKKHYYNRPPEIMAYAYDTVMNVDRKKNIQTYKEIGGEVYDLFKHYVEEYKKLLRIKYKNEKKGYR